MAEQQFNQGVPTKECKKCHSTIGKYEQKCPRCGANLKPIFKRVWFWVLVILLLIVGGMMSCTAMFAKSVSDNTNYISDQPAASSSSSSDAKSGEKAGDAASADQKDASSGKDAASSTGAEKYTVTGEQLVDKGYGFYSITGTFANNTDKKFSYVGLNYVLKDESGAQIGTGYANTTNLDAKGTWRFEAMATVSGDAEVASFELKEVQAY